MKGSQATQVEQSNSRSTLPNKLRHPCRHLKESFVDSGLDLVVSRCSSVLPVRMPNLFDMSGDRQKDLAPKCVTTMVEGLPKSFRRSKIAGRLGRLQPATGGSCSPTDSDGL